VLIPILVPLPFMVLGILVSIVQTLVFSLLTMVYIDMAVAHEEH
jgi:F-type H+-transporting ATPase subunit a